MFRKILIANRGEIALRVLRACRDMGIGTVAVYSTTDANSMPVRLADEAVCIGEPPPKDSYLNMQALLSAALITHAEAIHPGVGFLAENADFAEMVQEHHLAFIGPSPEHMRLMGDKITAKTTAEKIGLPTVPGSEGALLSLEHARRSAADLGYPVLIKATAGGGGRGMQVIEAEDQLEARMALCQQEAESAFGSPVVYMEKYLANPRHIEVQVMGDGRGKVVHFWERDCSVQRRHQKIIEEAPSPGLTAEQRQTICETVANSLSKMAYLGAGTVEFLFENDAFYFIEMNTRIQVEHPVSEEITGYDLIAEQIRVAAGEPLSMTQADIPLLGHAIECRITAEDPETLLPQPGLVRHYHVPGGVGVRVDSAIFEGAVIPPFYDSLIAKLIVRGATRPEALRRLRRALREYVIEGPKCLVPLHQRLVEEPAFLEGAYDIKWLETLLKKA